ncbi:hypothetical protein [Azospirillum sp.]|uniref:hypothetical protein n=1 Tax=Azospirillum sp. TaxID=34012 RepID=UPI003D7161DC
MARIADGDMTLSIRYAGYRLPEELIGYELLVTMDGRPLVNPDAIVWKPKPSSRLAWERLAPGALLCEGDPPCAFLSLFEQALATNRGQFCTFPGDDVEVALYPDFVLPVEPMVGMRDWDAWKAREEARAATPASADDVWELHLTIGWPQFHHREPGGTLAFQMLIQRHDLEAFAAALRQEYATFSARFDVPGQEPA